jgi:hypothetical protein
VADGLEKAAADLAFAMLGVDSDNDSAFINQSVFDYCKGHGLEQTRSRAYKKNDQAWVEQKSDSVVRRLVGYGPERHRRQERPGAAVGIVAAIHELFRAFVQAEVQDAPRRTRAQSLLRASDAVRSASGARQCRTRYQGETQGAVSQQKISVGVRHRTWTSTMFRAAVCLPA